MRKIIFFLYLLIEIKLIGFFLNQIFKYYLNCHYFLVNVGKKLSLKTLTHAQ